MCKEVFDLLGCSSFKRGISKTPSISFELELVDDVEASHNADHITAKEINDCMIPPAFLEIIHHVP